MTVKMQSDICFNFFYKLIMKKYNSQLNIILSIWLFV